MDIQSLINSRFGIGFGLAIGRIIPKSTGYWLTQKIADALSNRKESIMIRSLRANQWVVRNGLVSDSELDLIVRRNLRTNARCQFDLYHNIHRPELFDNFVNFSSETEAVIERIVEDKSSTVVVGVHTANLDIAFVAISRRNIKVLGISVPQPGGGYSWQNDIRTDLGVRIIPASKYALRAAYDYLSEGGTVVTGIDRPVGDTKYAPKFFERPAALPVFHVLMALKSNSPVYVASNSLLENGDYLVDVRGPFFMVSKNNRYDEIIYNSEMLLEVAADFIRTRPDQWAMYFPVWPEVLDKI
jgi:KDO2-lipid IV(A) lauroyltransferase